MGMFDSLYDTKGDEWQTKAFACVLDTYEIGENFGVVPSPQGRYDTDVEAFQVEVCGGPWGEMPTESFATVRDGILTAVPTERDEALPLLDYHGDWIAGPKLNNTKEA